MEPESATAAAAGAGALKRVEEREQVVIRFAGDSGDGMQVTGMQFTNESALAGNDLSTLPDFPAEIRAPAGTLAGVSGFQLNFSSREVFTPGDDLDVLVAMNPAALKVNLDDLQAERHPDRRQGAVQRAEPEEGGVRSRTRSTTARSTASRSSRSTSPSSPPTALKDTGPVGAHGDPLPQLLRARPDVLALPPPDRADRASGSQQRFKKTPELGRGQRRACCKAGYNFGETTEMFAHLVRGAAGAPSRPARYRNITGNTATALGFVAAAQRAGRPLFLGSYPITPASDILHELSTLQALRRLHLPGRGRDRRHRRGARRGVRRRASRSPPPAARACASRPRRSASRSASSCRSSSPTSSAAARRTGLPTKTEQADLLHGAVRPPRRVRRCPILAAATPADCFATAFEAVRIAVKYMTPVILLSDGYLANGAEPWLIPRRRRAAGDHGRLPHRPEGLLPLPARRGDAVAPVGRSRARRASSTASAASRRST